MRRIDVFGIGLGICAATGLIYFVFQVAGLDATNAGIWTQVLLFAGLVGWLATYILRAVSGSMTYHQQRREYEDAVLQKRLDELTPEALEALQAEIEQEKKSASKPIQ
jgi:membrane protein implicated in regulation of membrane protease activity